MINVLCFYPNYRKEARKKFTIFGVERQISQRYKRVFVSLKSRQWPHRHVQINAFNSKNVYGVRAMVRCAESCRHSGRLFSVCHPIMHIKLHLSMMDILCARERCLHSIKLTFTVFFLSNFKRSRLKSKSYKYLNDVIHIHYFSGKFHTISNSATEY